MGREPSPALAPTETVVALRWPFYLFSVFVPFAGIVIALFLIGSDSKPVRRVAQVCLWIGFICWVLLPAFLLFVLIMVVLTALSGLLSGLTPLDIWE
jgi:hypothetical protein